MTTFSRVGGANFSPLNNIPWSQGESAPLWASSNGGRTWDIQAGIPRPGANVGGILDQTIAYNSGGSALYGAFLGGELPINSTDRPPDTVYVRSTTDPYTAFGGAHVHIHTPGGSDQESHRRSAVSAGGHHRNERLSFRRL